MSDSKPLMWTPKAGIGYTVNRRPDGGMTLTFSDLSEATISDWREFAFEHLMGSDRLTRNLYDLRQVKEIPEKAIKMAVEVNNDPSTRNVRAAVVVASQQVKDAIMKVAASATVTGAAVRVFTVIDEAEAWLAKPLDQMV
ncbi:MAG: hypothetical protein CVU44_01030 [Chloroflexi bacterium HGW-Chloroflexi-6]|nr:MAG: hypothetical protein CVU44_01030 [Chloroflexi bacterium HGW-Chloroflexi-6]